MNAVEIEEAVEQLVERIAAEGFDAEAFPFEFLEAFGNPRTTIDRLRAGGKSSTNRSDVPGGVLQTKNIHLATAAPWETAEKLQELLDSPETAKRNCKFVLATDGETVEAESLTPDGAGETLACPLAELPERFGFFLELAGIRTVPAIRENAFDVKATGRLNKLYVELLRENPDWGEEARREDMNHFMARLIFCFFAEDTRIFGDDQFTGAVRTLSERDGSNVHEVLANCFLAMDSPLDAEARRAAGVRPYAMGFPYVNGGLFAGGGDPDSVPRFGQTARSYLLHIGGLDWTKINPDIFGSMIQAVAGEEDRARLGMHYTSVPNILKVLNPLFLDSLREKLKDATEPKVRPQALRWLRKRLSRIRVFDPACGSGNFLVIAYKQLREIEAKINENLGEAERQSEIPLTNFRGIEIRHFAAEVARLALIIAEYQADVLHRGQLLALADFLPLGKENWIVHGNALRLDWQRVCPPSGQEASASPTDLLSRAEGGEIDFENEGGETYICGNPPYLGKGKLSASNREDLRNIFQGRIRNFGYIDLVGAWFIKASDYCRRVDSAAALVSTNSVVMGRQAADLWPAVLAEGVKIHFAYESFWWSNMAARNAAVSVVIVGLASNDDTPCILYNNDEERHVEAISHYLTAGDAPLVTARSDTLSSDLPTMILGNKPNDGRALRVSAASRREVISADAAADGFLRPFYGSDEFNGGVVNYSIWVDDADLEDALTCSAIGSRIELCRKKRLAFKDSSNRQLAKRPHQMREHVSSTESTIIVPISTSEKRQYIPAGILPAKTVVSSQAFALHDAGTWALSVINSRLHLAWVAAIGGKFKIDYRYSNDLGWNTFPVPELTEQNKADLTACAEAILLAREAHWPATIAQMYDPEAMDRDYPDLRQAHDRNDETLERIYLGRRFRNDTERLEHLFARYTEMTAAESNP
ncbi:class I SAM-dependent DNA methyltransferase [Phycisphaera mikurensis]|uniref:site-specific DNA-methyltransferase (adenine-specific) n=1 Tax=Phycisphaera mikurensis (strain NBRC 102666 / KCTC 22515 / FYK2301M01) TaxID=1142394 RepID=I0IB01_PHYMF|nr:DNA methyltransferase [Phycisphaera mikurensis]MBB6442589.1 hypothetical protein [Phycisphaera mikurensis]BAM02439.1 restriction endonuclease/modification methylase [Phycisphaera mikurensis NBRC 102666]